MYNCGFVIDKEEIAEYDLTKVLKILPSVGDKLAHKSELFTVCRVYISLDNDIDMIIVLKRVITRV